MTLGSHNRTTDLTHTPYTLPASLSTSVAPGEYPSSSEDRSVDTDNIPPSTSSPSTSRLREAADISTPSPMAPRSSQTYGSPVQETSHALFGPAAMLSPPAKSSTMSPSTRSVNKGKDIKAGFKEPWENSNVETNIPSERTTASSSMDSILHTIRPGSTSAERLGVPDTLCGDELREPYPDQHVSSSVSEVLSRASTTASIVQQDQFVGSVSYSPASGQCNGLMRRLPRDLHDLPESVITRLLGYLTQADYLSLRLTCRSLSARFTCIKPLRLAAVYFLPVEILQQIFALLRPVEFNAARHTCRAWMMSSLKKSLLIAMLKRAGWWSCAQTEVASYSQRRGLPSEGMSEEWLLSKKLARECSLGPDWTGNGLRGLASQTSEDDLTGENVEVESFGTPRETDAKYLTGLALTSTVDFSELGSASVGSPHGPGLIFTVSICGKYLMVAEGCLIYVYSFLSGDDGTDSPVGRGGSLRGITSVVCPRRVLAVSMDTSSQRFAIAVLMDGRMGLVCDLHHNPNQRVRKPGLSPYQMSDVAQGEMSYQLPGSYKLAGVALQGCAHKSDQAISEPATANDTDWASSGQYDRHACMLNNTFRGSIDEANPNPIRSTSSTTDANNVNIETGPRSIYRNLCSEEDPPRSVAICPQRRCVAFGCAAGIELHWVDALTGQDLNRWFPLTAPSDFLFFLPPRKGIDSSKKLRLISSAGRSGDRPVIASRFFCAAQTEGFWSNILFSSGADSALMNTSDHYRALPLSDGSHVVFTDPATACVCIGSDAPVGGPTKLVRRIMLLGPKVEEGRGDGVWPACYAVGRELREGVRVVVCYGEGVWLFCVPGDVWVGAKGDKDGGCEDWKDFWKRDVEGEMGEGGFLWPIKVRGKEIGRVHGGVVDLAVECGEGMLRVWAFARGGEARVWEIDDGRKMGVRRRGVVRGGRVVDFDCEGEREEGRVGGFDGATSSEDIGSSDDMDLDDSFEDEGVAHVDLDGDVEMMDAPDWDGNQGVGGSRTGTERHRLEESGSADSVEWIVDLLRERGDMEGGWEGDEGFFDGLGVGRLVCDVL